MNELQLARNIAADAIDQLEVALRKRKNKWWKWHLQNPQVWMLFEQYTFDAMDSGRRHYSHWNIVGRIRWNHEVETRGGEFKISNDFIGWYARLFHHKYPEHSDFFRLRPLKEETRLRELKQRTGVILKFPNQ